VFAARALAIAITGINSIMDKRLIEQYGQEILSYRIRTARQKRRAVYEDFDKWLLALHREETALSKQKFSLGWEPIVPPVQKGWVRSFVLRDDTAIARHADFFAGILMKINTHVYSHRKDFRVRKRKMGRRIYVVRKQMLMEPPPDSFRRMKFTEEEKAFFQLVEDMPDQKGHIYSRYVFKEPWRFVLKVRPNIIHKVRIKDFALEQRMGDIFDYLESNDHRCRQKKLLYGYNRWNYHWQGEEYHNPNPIKNKTLLQILEEAKEGLL